MATIALDATYTVDREPTGVTVYSRGLIEALAKLDRAHRYLLCYRLSRFGRRNEFLRPANSRGGRGPTFSIKLYQEPLTFWLPWQASLFHSLAQRPPGFAFQKEVVTVFDLFTLTEKDYFSAQFRRKFSALLLEALYRAARIITLSRYTANQLVEHCGVPRERIRVVPAGVDPPKARMKVQERLRERAALVGEGNQMVLSVGAVQTRKNILNVLRAVSMLPPRYKLVLAGGSGYGSEPIYDFIRAERLESRVIRLGYVTAQRLPFLYEAASILLFPSLGEGFGFPVLEAMAHGLPVVTSNVSSLPEVGGDAALYVDPRDPADIAQNVVRAVEDHSLRDSMIRQGLARARDFTWRRTAEQTCDVYDEVLAM
jgi:alpha-1,3-rhamnosyl/mannosyltransferase